MPRNPKRPNQFQEQGRGGDGAPKTVLPKFEQLLTDLVSNIPVAQAAELLTVVQRWKELRQQFADANPWLPSSWLTGSGIAPGTGDLLYQLARINLQAVQQVSNFTLDALEGQFREIRKRRAGQYRRTIELHGRLGEWARARVAPRLWNDTTSLQILALKPGTLTDDAGKPVGAAIEGFQHDLFAIAMTPPAKGAVDGRNTIDTTIRIPAQSKKAIQIEVHLVATDDNGNPVFDAADSRADTPISGLYVADVDVVSASNRSFVVDQMRLEIHVAKPAPRAPVKPSIPKMET